MRNLFELKVAATLSEDYSYEAVRLTYTVEKTYLPDWVKVHDGTVAEIVEAKGYFPAPDRAKMKAIRTQYPKIRITMVFQEPSRTISKASKTTYAQWCDRNGIHWTKG